jgi:E3 ubiquitin-protein ligase UBR1
MSRLSQFFPNPFGGRDQRQPDPHARLKYTLETMPAAQQYRYSAAARAQLLAELYDNFWGSHTHLFLPPGAHGVAASPTGLLSDLQKTARFHGAGEDEPPLAGRPCGHIFSKGESCFRCKCVRVPPRAPGAHR